MNSSIENWPLLRIQQRSTNEWRAVSELVFLEGSANYTWLVWSDGLRLLLPNTMKSVLARLPPSQFIRLHRQFAVNHHFVDKSKILAERSKVYLTTGESSLPISRRRRSGIHQQLIEAMSATELATFDWRLFMRRFRDKPLRQSDSI
ncbi:LytR/AlgR family response regulator transcription factor [Spirosoma pulveris]